MKTFKQMLATLCMILDLQFRLIHCTDTAKNLPEANPKDVCSSLDCNEEASLFLENMDKEIDPCDDFYRFACGNIEKTTPSTKLNKDILLSEITEHLMRVIYSYTSGAVIDQRSKKFEALEKARIFYNNCINDAQSEDTNMEPFLEVLQKLGGWPLLLKKDWNEEAYAWEDMYKNIEFIGIAKSLPFLLRPAVGRDNEEKYNVMVNPIWNGAVYGTLLQNRTIMNAYYEYIVDIAIMLGADENEAREELKDCLDFEMNLAEFLPLLRDFPTQLEQTSIVDLNKKYPSVNWKKFFNNVLSLANESIAEDESFKINGANYLYECGKLINRTSKRTIANYQFLQLLNGMIEFMPLKFYRRKLMFNDVIHKSDMKENKRSNCWSETTDNFYFIELAFTVRKYGDTKDLVKKVNNLIPIIRNQYKRNFDARTDIDEAMKKTILEKLDAMKTVIGYPEELLSDEKLDEYYKGLKINIGSYFISHLNISKFLLEKRFKHFKNPVEKGWVFKAEATVIEDYLDDNVNIVTPVRSLHTQLIHPNGPEYLSYGAIGFIIAHKIAHVLDMSTQRFETDEDNETQEWFDEFHECLIQKYNNYEIFDNISVNGTSTLKENIADNEGFKIAYQAYDEWTRHNNITEPPLPGVDYTPKQMFWIGAANIFCEKLNRNFIEEEIKWGRHSPKIARVNVAFSNLNEFAKDFHCKIGSKMNPEKKCDMW